MRKRLRLNGEYGLACAIKLGLIRGDKGMRINEPCKLGLLWAKVKFYLGILITLGVLGKCVAGSARSSSRYFPEHHRGHLGQPVLVPLLRLRVAPGE